MATLEERREWGRKGARIRRARKQQLAVDPLLPVKEALPGAFDQLVKASKGEGRWKELSIKDQLAALYKVVEYGIGKSVTLDKMTPKNPAEDGDGTEAEGGIAFN